MELTIEQLKVQAYDLLAAIEHYQARLHETNTLIAQRAQQSQPVSVPESQEEASENTHQE